MSTDTGNNTEWEGYANYQEVSKRISRSVFQAVDSYAWIQGAHQEGSNIKPEDAADARADILSAAIRLYVEMQQEKSDYGVEKYDNILDDWSGEDGFIARFHQISLRQNCPGWIGTFVMQIRQAGWALGYLQAGRRSKQEPDDPVEAEVEAMFEGL